MISRDWGIMSKKKDENKRLALVIGNASYRHVPLRNPRNDAQDVAESLESLGFLVSLELDATRPKMREAIRKFGKDLKGKEIGLFYYSGHGIQVQGINYLVPIGADIHAEHEVEDEAMQAEAVLRTMEEAENPTNIIILDACRDNPFKGWSRSTARGLSQMKAPKGSLLVYATAPGQVASDGNEKDRNGIFSKHFLKHLQMPGLEVRDLLIEVRNGVQQETNDA